MIKYICFDLDNTLYEHKEFAFGAYSEISKYLEKNYSICSKEFYDEICEKWIQLTSRCDTIFTTALQKRKIYSKFLENKLVEIYRSHSPSIALYQNVRERLMELLKNKYKLGILTDGQPNVQRKKLQKLNIEELFSEVVVTGNYGKEFYKPHPKGFKELKNRFNTEYKFIAYIGDNPKTDFYTPHQLGMMTIRVMEGEFSKEKEIIEYADMTFNKTVEAIDWFLKK